MAFSICQFLYLDFNSSRLSCMLSCLLFITGTCPFFLSHTFDTDVFLSNRTMPLMSYHYTLLEFLISTFARLQPARCQSSINQKTDPWIIRLDTALGPDGYACIVNSGREQADAIIRAMECYVADCRLS